MSIELEVFKPALGAAGRAERDEALAEGDFRRVNLRAADEAPPLMRAPLGSEVRSGGRVGRLVGVERTFGEDGTTVEVAVVAWGPDAPAPPDLSKARDAIRQGALAALVAARGTGHPARRRAERSAGGMAS